MPDVVFLERFAIIFFSVFAVEWIIFGISLAIYHWCIFLPRLKNQEYELPPMEEDTCVALEKIAKKHEKLEHTQDDDEDYEVKTAQAEEDSLIERTQEEFDARGNLAAMLKRVKHLPIKTPNVSYRSLKSAKTAPRALHINNNSAKTAPKAIILQSKESDTNASEIAEILPLQKTQSLDPQDF